MGEAFSFHYWISSERTYYTSLGHHFMACKARKAAMSYDFTQVIPDNDPDMVYLNNFKVLAFTKRLYTNDKVPCVQTSKSC